MTVQSTTPAPGAVTLAPAAIVTRTKPPKLTWTSGSIGISLVVWGLALLYALPIVWFLLSSFKPGSELFRYPLTMFPDNWTVSGYTTAWTRFNIGA